MRVAKVARGLGNGIHLPSNLIETCELVLLNLRNLPATRPPSSKKNRGVVNFDYINDAIMSNGASLKRDAGRWYDRDGGIAWSMDIIQSSFSEPGAQFELSSKALAEKVAESYMQLNVLRLEQMHSIGWFHLMSNMERNQQ